MRRMLAFTMRYVYAAASCLYLFLLGWMFAKNRALIIAICTHFGYGKKSTPGIIPKIPIRELLPDDISIQVREPIDVDGNMTLFEVVVLTKLIRRHDPRTLFEIGTFDGRTTLNMAANSSGDARVYTLDLPKDQGELTALPISVGDARYIDKPVSGSRYLGTDCAGKIVQLYGDSATFDFSPYFNAVDFVLIDGAHSYEYVLSDTERALRLLRNGRGVILWHDYASWEGVTKALNHLHSTERGSLALRHIEGTTFVCLIAV